MSDQSVSDGGEVGEGGDLVQEAYIYTSQSTATRPVALTRESVA